MAIEKAELKFEDELIHKLETLGGVKQWKYEPSIKTTEELWNNFKRILEENNHFLISHCFDILIPTIATY